MISLKEITHHNEHFTAISSNGSVSTLVLSAPKALFAGAIISVFPTSRGSVHPKFALHFPDLCFSISGGLKQLAILLSAAISLIYFAVILPTLLLRKTKTGTANKAFENPGGMILAGIGRRANSKKINFPEKKMHCYK